MQTTKKHIYVLAVGLAGCLASSMSLSAQESARETASATASSEPIVVQQLFEYPTPPDDMVNLQDRANYIVDRFWEPMDFKAKQTVDQSALNHAFDVYVTAMRFADARNGEQSVDKLIGSISKNPPLSLQFAKAAEESLYGLRANVWNDEMFLRFIDNVLSNKQVKPERKLRLQRLKSQLTNTMVGTLPPEFDYTTPSGAPAHYFPNGIITVIEFGDPDCDGCRYAKLKMDTDVRFSTLVDKGKVNVLFINVDPEEGWEEKLAAYPPKWHVGASDDVYDIYDIRDIPSLYVIDREGKVAAKHVDVTTAMSIASAAAEQ